ncbi:MAG: hypothetical protein WDZ50_03025 [Woeseia sp.]
MLNRAHAVVVLPAVLGGRIADAGIRRWLSKAELRVDNTRVEPLARVLSVLGQPPVTSGLAALRLWGQTGHRPVGWQCGADPVYLEARLDRLYLHALQDVSAAQTEGVFHYLQTTLATGRPYAFHRVDSSGYLQREDAMATMPIRASTAHGHSPDDFLLEGPPPALHDALQSELQMCLHECDVNQERAKAGHYPVNSLWFWGGGVTSPLQAQRLPALFCDDPLLTGYWLRSDQTPHRWPGSLAACVMGADSFVAVTPCDANAADAESCLDELRMHLARRRIARLTMLFRDGLHADMRRRHRLRVWRRSAPQLSPGGI